MTRRITSAVLAALGILAIVLAVLSATTWRPDDRATLSLPARPDEPLVLTDPGVLDAVAEDVTITAAADDDQPVVLAVGTSADVDAWVGATPALRVTGLASWDELRTEERAADEEPAEGETAEGGPAADATAASPAGSDLWVAQATGTGSAELRWEHRPGRWSLLAATDGAAPAPHLTFTWPVEVRTPWLVPGVAVGVLLLLAGLALVALDVLARREAERRRTVAAERAATRATADLSETTVMTPVTGTAGLTRRELRERARAEQAAQRAPRPRRGLTPSRRQAGPRTDPEPGTETTAALSAAGPARGAGIVPAVVDAARYRDRALPPDVAAAPPVEPATAERVAVVRPAPATSPPAPDAAPGTGVAESATSPDADLTDDAADVDADEDLTPRWAALDAAPGQEPAPAAEPDQPSSQWRSLWAFTEAPPTAPDKPEEEDR